jgi:CRP-like cAMP-binding protein
LAATPQNHLIELLPRRDKAVLLGLCQPATLTLSDVLTERGQPTRHVWFPVTAFVSLVAQIDDHPGLEVGMVGREGMLGAPLALGVQEVPLRAVVQGGGSAWRVEVGPFRAEMARSAALRQLLGRYLYVRLAQLAASAACLRFHQIGPRLARWLLMSQDRAHAEHFHVTHEFLAYMLGMRRVGVTVAAGVLQRNGLIHYHRGELTVLNRAGLEAAACPCYAADQDAYATHMRGGAATAP